MPKTHTGEFSRTTAGLLTLALMLSAFAIANSPARDLYQVVHHLPVGVHVGTFGIHKPLILWINDGLMVFFFLLIALDLKRESLEGQLSTISALATPGLAALGGMVVPALIYAAFNLADPVAMRGWAIPTATDAVLALTVLALLGSRVPLSLKVFLTAVAIFDDLGAIVIIALFYTEDISALSLAMASIGIVALVLLNAGNVSSKAPYVVVGVFLWVAVLKSGVHATLAGVAIGLAIPMKAVHNGEAFSPLRETERQLGPWVALGVVPVFAFFNSGIPLSADAVSAVMSPGGLGIILGLFLGKQVGILGATWLGVRLGLATFPAGASWLQIYGVALAAGIGFTMSLFIAGLAFADPGAFRDARLAVVVGSVLSAIGAGLVLRWAPRTAQKTG